MLGLGLNRVKCGRSVCRTKTGENRKTGPVVNIYSWSLSTPPRHPYTDHRALTHVCSLGFILPEREAGVKGSRYIHRKVKAICADLKTTEVNPHRAVSLVLWKVATAHLQRKTWSKCSHQQCGFHSKTGPTASRRHILFAELARVGHIKFSTFKSNKL